MGRFVLAPLKGQPVAGGFVPTRRPIPILIDGAWGLGVGLILAPLVSKMPAARA